MDIRETVQNGDEDEDGYDMFVQVSPSFLKSIKMHGRWKELPIQIKSSRRRIKSFVRKYAKQLRFFNVSRRSHLFVLCGMNDEELILADIVGQIIVHTLGFDMSEKETLNCLNSFGDKVAVEAYKRNKPQLICLWYGQKLPT